MADTDFIILIGPRACGKSTVAMSLRKLLPAWDVLDIDRMYEIRNRNAKRSPLMVNSEDYYNACKDLVLEHLADSPAVMALGGGTLINRAHQQGDLDLIIECKKRAPLVLLLPSRFDWVNRRVLYRRESERGYELPPASRKKLKQFCYDQYKKRIGFYKANADLIIFGGSPDDVAKRLVDRYDLQAREIA